MTVLISADALHEHIDRFSIIDCRFDLANPAQGGRDFLDGHIPGAAYADLNEDLAAPVGANTGRHPLPDTDTLVATLRSLGVSGDRPVVVYDAGNGAMAARAWWLLRYLGHEDVRLLDGGLNGWLESGFELESGNASVVRGDFVGAPDTELVVTTAELTQPDRTLRLVDARDEARFRGEVEPIDPVAGHVPGARSLPFTGNLDDDGRWRSPEELKQRLEDALDGDTANPWAVMCGSGVTACHLALAAVQAGLPEPRVYVGSWSEWISDPSRPVARGPAE